TALIDSDALKVALSGRTVPVLSFSGSWNAGGAVRTWELDLTGLRSVRVIVTSAIKGPARGRIVGMLDSRETGVHRSGVPAVSIVDLDAAIDDTDVVPTSDHPFVGYHEFPVPADNVVLYTKNAD